jgi:hypothetical protein
VAVELWLGLGLAIAKILLRAADKSDAADALDDAHGGWSILRAGRGKEHTLGKFIAKELEQQLGDTSGAVEDDLRAAAQDVADLVSHLAEDDDAVVAAATYPDEFLDYVKKHGGDKKRRLMSERAALAFDQILGVASAEFARLAPSSSSSRFLPTALTEILGQLPSIAADAGRAADGIDELRSAPYEKAWAVLDGLARRLREGVRSDLAAGDVRLELARAGERARLVTAMTNAGHQGRQPAPQPGCPMQTRLRPSCDPRQSWRQPTEFQATLGRAELVVCSRAGKSLAEGLDRDYDLLARRELQLRAGRFCFDLEITSWCVHRCVQFGSD